MPKNFDKANSLGVFKYYSGYGSYDTRMRAPQYHSSVKTELIPTTDARAKARQKTQHERQESAIELLRLIKDRM